MLISNYGVDVSIFDKCHHNITFGKVNIRVLRHPVCIRGVWNYSQANIDNIKYAISNFNRSKALDGDGELKHLNDTLLNIFRNYIPNKKTKSNFRESPWINDNIKSSLKQRSKLTKIFYKNGLRKSDRIKALEKSAECTKKILEAKKSYILQMATNLNILILLQKLIGQC